MGAEAAGCDAPVGVCALFARHLAESIQQLDRAGDHIQRPGYESLAPIPGVVDATPRYVDHRPAPRSVLRDVITKVHGVEKDACPCGGGA
eukprot:scaffold14916_cov128-Isochrysis_galbana.AAC.13